MIDQYTFRLQAQPRGYHIITREVMSQIPHLPEKGIFHLFIHHTSAAITINEAADPDVLVDFESIMNKIVPENLPFLVHTMEGPDDMPAHIKAALIGTTIQIPIIESKLALGTWQGLYLCEFRNHGGSRKVTASIYS